MTEVWTSTLMKPKICLFWKKIIAAKLLSGWMNLFGIVIICNVKAFCLKILLKKSLKTSYQWPHKKDLNPPEFLKLKEREKKKKDSSWLSLGILMLNYE